MVSGLETRKCLLHLKQCGQLCAFSEMKFSVSSFLLTTLYIHYNNIRITILFILQIEMKFYIRYKTLDLTFKN